MSKAVGGPPAPTLARPAGKESSSSGSFLAVPASPRRSLHLSNDAGQRGRRSARAMCEAGAETASGSHGTRLRRELLQVDAAAVARSGAPRRAAAEVAQSQPNAGARSRTQRAGRAAFG